jgi:hypothetical protein
MKTKRIYRDELGNIEHPTEEKEYTLRFTEDQWYRLHEALDEVLAASDVCDQGKNILVETLVDPMNAIAEMESIDAQMLRNAH